MERGLLINYRGAVVLMQPTAIDMLPSLINYEKGTLVTYGSIYLQNADASGIACCLPSEKGTLVTYGSISASCRRFRHRMLPSL